MLTSFPTKLLEVDHTHTHTYKISGRPSSHMYIIVSPQTIPSSSNRPAFVFTISIWPTYRKMPAMRYLPHTRRYTRDQHADIYANFSLLAKKGLTEFVAYFLAVSETIERASFPLGHTISSSEVWHCV